MKVRIFITLISFSFLSLLINGCGDNGHSSHYSGSGNFQLSDHLGEIIVIAFFSPM